MCNVLNAYCWLAGDTRLATSCELFMTGMIVRYYSVIRHAMLTFYHRLARDPNSLANLDQDLPNYAQHQVSNEELCLLHITNVVLQVPIHSLPQEWLWCETWCSDGSKSTVCKSQFDCTIFLSYFSYFFMFCIRPRQ